MIGGNDAQNNAIAMTNNVSFNQASTSQSTPLVRILKHSIFSAKLVNRIAFGNNTWAMDTGASDHIICSISLFQSYTIVSHYVVELPNGELAHVTHIGTVKLLASLSLNMFFVFHHSLSIFYLLVNLLKSCLFVLCFCLNSASFRTSLVGLRLEWVKSTMVCTCCRNPPLGLHLLCLFIFPPTRLSSHLFQLLLPIKICKLYGILD